jgi:hypothetical protein
MPRMGIPSDMGSLDWVRIGGVPILGMRGR